MPARHALAGALTALLLVAATAAAQDGGLPDGGLPDGGVAAVPAAPEPDAQADMLPRDRWPEMDVSIEPASGVKVGDLVTVTVTADAAAGDDLAVPRQDLTPFEIHSTDVKVEERDDGKRFVFTLKLLAFEAGDHSVGPLRLRVVTSDGTIGRVETESMPVSVGSLLGNEPDAQLRPATEPVRVMEEDYTLAWIGGGLLAVLLLAAIMFFVARWWMRRERPAAPPPPPRPAWDVALEKLEALRRTLPATLEDGDVEGWADALSDAVREYLGHRYEFEGLESTTDEVISRLRKLQPRGISVEEVAAVLGDADLVKFAKASADQAQCEQMLDAGYRIVQRTKPSFAEQQQAEARDVAPPGGPSPTPPSAPAPPAGGAA